MPELFNTPIYRVVLVRDSSQKTPAAINVPADAAQILQTYLTGQDRENFVVILLDAKYRIIGINTVSVGDLNSALAHPREVFKPAILANAAAIILGHNHPSGDPAPSPADLAASKKLCEAGKILEIKVLDNLIVTDERFFSLKEHDML